MLHDTRNPVGACMPLADVMSHESVSFALAGSTGLQPRQFNQWLDRVSRFVSNSGPEEAKSRSRSLQRKKPSCRDRAPLAKTPPKKRRAEEDDVPIKAKPSEPPAVMTPRATPAPNSPPPRSMSSRGHSAPPHRIQPWHGC